MATQKILLLLLSLLFTAAAALGIYWWRYEQPTMQNYRQQQSEKDSFQDYYNAGANITEDPSITTEVSFLAVGDIMLSRSVAGVMAKNQKDALLPFRELDRLLLGTDFNFGNLESPFSGTDEFNPLGGMVFNAPKWAIEGLVHYNFKILNLANNHAMDQGKDALMYTKQFLKERGLTGFGVGGDLKEAWEGDLITAKGIDIGFIGASYASSNDGGAGRNSYVARIDDTTNLQQSIAAMKAQADFIVVAMHAGEEYTRQPNKDQINFAHAAIDAGADLIISAHPHWIQPTEKYKNKYIFYSLGNFIFDQEWSQDTKEGLTLKVTVSKNTTCNSGPALSIPHGPKQDPACTDDIQGTRQAATLKQIELIPIIIENYSTPRLANETEKQAILKKIGATTNIVTP